MAAFGCALSAAVPAAHAALSVPSATYTSISAFKAAAGGVDNGTAPGEQGAGFRQLTWDGFALDGSDPGSTVVRAGHVVALARSAAQPWGLELGPAVAVADRFASVNPHAGSAPFSAPNEWAPFNSPSTEFQVVAPSGSATSPAPALTRGLGVVFLDVHSTGINTTDTTIEYFNGQTSLGTVFAPAGATSFVGVLFRDPVVSRVVINMGSAAMFSLDGSAGASNPVAGDDVALAEPGAGQPALTATAGAPISATLAGFNDTDPGARPTDFRASIDWGDGTRTPGTIASSPAGGFVVSGSHTYAVAGAYSPRVTVNDFSGSQLASDASIQVAARPTVTALACSPPAVAVSAGTTCTATVTDAGASGASTPTGLVSFSTTTPGASFAQGQGCVLGPSATAGVASCGVVFTPGELPPTQARVAAGYAGDAAHAASVASASVGVRAQRCTLRTLTRRLRSSGLAVLVTCDARAGVQIGVKALATRTRRFKSFQLGFGSLRSAVTAGRPTVLVIKPARGVLPALRGALRHHQRVSLRLTLTASSHATTRTTTTRVSALRLS